MSQITRMYWVMANDGTLPFASPAQFETYMSAGPGETNLETGLPGVVHGIALGTQEHADFMTYALHEASKTPGAQRADWASYGFGAGSLWSGSGDSSSTPAPASSPPAPQTSPAPSQAYTDLQGNWSGTGISFSLVPDSSNPAALDLANNGYQASGVPGPNELVLSGTQSGGDPGVILTLTYNLAQSPNTMTASDDGGDLGTVQVSRTS
jgi:hypothetical protein